MLTKLQELTDEREEGFTLIELLVVILIIGILSAIAIPAFLNQRKSAVDSTLQADLASTAKGVETWVSKQGATEKPLELARIQNVTGQTEMLPATGVATELAQMKLSDGSVIEVSGTSYGYCLRGVNEGGDEASPEKLGYVYASLSGGLKKTPGTCKDGVFTPGFGGIGEPSGPGYGGEPSGPGYGGGESGPVYGGEESGPGSEDIEPDCEGLAGTESSCTGEVVVNDSETTNHVANLRVSDSWEVIRVVPYSVTRSSNGSSMAYNYTFSFTDSSINGVIDVSICNPSDGNCRDYPLNVSGGTGSVGGDEEYSAYNGSMDTIMLADGTMLTLF